MSSLIISTVGTSLLSRVRRDRGLQPHERPDHRVILAEINRLASSDRRCGAEINSIQSLLDRGRIGRQSLDGPFRFVFLVSDTDDGAWTGRLLKQYAESGLRDVAIESVEVDTVEGLQPDDPERFARTGLRNLVKRACAHINRFTKHNGPDAARVINATGGYKAQISLAGLIGQTVGVPVAYMFEAFEYVIEMPPMPVEFNREVWLEHYDLFVRMSEEGQIETDDPGLDGADPMIVELLDRVEEDGVYLYALSPIFELMHMGFLIREWPREVKPPRDSDKQAEAKLAISESEMPHAPKGSRKRMQDLAKLPWTTRISNIGFADTRRSRIISKKNPDRPDEIQLYHADSDKALVIAVRTTCRDDGERLWCLRRLAEILRS